MSEPLFKLLLIGDSAVGKSCLLLRFAEETYQDGTINMTSVEFKTKIITVDGRQVQLQVWDTAGQERFRTITSSFYRGAHGIIVVYDITEQGTFNNVKLWMQEIQRYASASVSKMLVGNKADLEERRVVPTATAKEYADGIAIPFAETSAKTGLSVEAAFHRITSDVLRAQGGASYGPSGVVKTDFRSQDKGKKRC